MDQFKEESVRYVLNFKGTKKYLDENGNLTYIKEAKKFRGRKEAREWLARKAFSKSKIDLNEFKVAKIKIRTIIEILN